MERSGEERREREGERVKGLRLNLFCWKKKKKRFGNVAGQDWLV